MLVIDCLYQRITGLGVTNSEGSLVDTLSVRDLRGMGVNAEHFERLWHTVARYKEEVRRDFKRQTPPKPIHVTRDDTLRHVITRMDDGNIHRVFVVEKQRREGGSGEELWRPTHVITQRDVMRFLLFKMGLQPMSAQHYTATCARHFVCACPTDHSHHLPSLAYFIAGRWSRCHKQTGKAIGRKGGVQRLTLAAKKLSRPMWM